MKKRREACPATFERKKVSRHKNELKTSVIAYSGVPFSTASSPIICKKMHVYLGVGPMHSVGVCV